MREERGHLVTKGKEKGRKEEEKKVRGKALNTWISNLGKTRGTLFLFLALFSWDLLEVIEKGRMLDTETEEKGDSIDVQFTFILFFFPIWESERDEGN